MRAASTGYGPADRMLEKAASLTARTDEAAARQVGKQPTSSTVTASCETEVLQRFHFIRF